MQTKWDPSMLRAGDIAALSNDPSTQNGAVLSTEEGEPLTGGYNWILGAASRPERLERPLKYQCVIHAEQAVLSVAAFAGFRTNGLTLVCPWAACDRCAVSIMACGIRRIVTFERKEDETHSRWEDSVAIADELLAEQGVEMVFIDPPEGFPPLLRNGELVQP